MDNQNESSSTGWSFLTNHGHVLVALHRNPELRQRDIAFLVGITEGAVNRILVDLQNCGYIAVEKVGRRNHYHVDVNQGMRHPLEHGHTVAEFLNQLATEPGPVALQADAVGAGRPTL